MINSDSALYSICGASTNKGDLLNIVAQPNMTDDEKNKVNPPSTNNFINLNMIKTLQIIKDLIKGESNGDPIPWITSQGNSRPRAPSKKEQYKRLWVELDTLLEAYQGNSVNHRFLYESFLDQVGKSNNNFKRGTDKIEVGLKNEMIWIHFDSRKWTRRIQKLQKLKLFEILHFLTFSKLKMIRLCQENSMDSRLD